MNRDELLKLIDQAAHERWTELDLQDEGLTELPPEIGHLKNLETLNLGCYRHELYYSSGHNQLTCLPPEIGCLIQLQSLTLRNNCLTTFPLEIGRLTQLRVLDLSKNKLTILSPEIGQLTELRELDLGGNRLTSLPPAIGQLTQLQSLYLHDNHLTVFPPEIGQLTTLQELYLYGNGLTALPSEIGLLSRLQLLDLGFNGLTALSPEVVHLTGLQYLILQFNQLTIFPSEIVQLSTLHQLSLGRNGLTALPREIGQLTALESLDLSNNQLVALPLEIGQLTAMRSLDLSNNQLTALPTEIIQLPALEELDLRDNPLPFPPEILVQTDDPAAIQRAWADYLGGQKRPHNEVKMVLVGEGSVGKTSLVNRLLYDTFAPDSDKTEGIAIHRWKIANERESEKASQQGSESAIRVNVWDFGGQEIMHATHQFFLTKRTLYVLVLDNRLSEVENRLDYWLALIRSFGSDSPILVVGNKTDKHPLDLDRRGLLAKHPTVQTILETSCATGSGIPALREAVAQQIAHMPHIADPLVTAWFDVKAELEALNADYIPYADYIRICREKNVDNPESQRVLLGFLHDLGVVLHFPDPRLEMTNILSPEWVTRGVYRVLNTRLPFAEPGVLSWDMLTRILDDEPYQGKRLFIVDMMQKFELCYEIPDRPHTYLIPDLLPKEARDTGAWDDALRFEVHYSVLPCSILTRLIVRMHRHIKEQTVWRTGVLLACDGNEALVTADLAANRIAIAVHGPGTGRRELLTRIREPLEVIHASLAGLEAAEKVPVPGHPQIPPVDYKWLRELERKGVLEFYPPDLTDPISVRQLLDGVEPPSARRELERRGGNTFVTNVYGGQVGVIGDDADVDGGIHS